MASDAGFPPHHLQYPVHDLSGVLLGRGDMAYDRPGGRPLVIEADGAEVHSQPEALFRDRLRANDFVTSGGVDVLRFTWSDLSRRGCIASMLRRNLRPVCRNARVDLERCAVRHGVATAHLSRSTPKPWVAGGRSYCS